MATSSGSSPAGAPASAVLAGFLMVIWGTMSSSLLSQAVSIRQAKAAVIRVETESDFIEISVFLVKTPKCAFGAIF
jgi:hypothetical protein